MTHLPKIQTDTLWPYPQVKENFQRENRETDYQAPWVEIGAEDYSWFLNCVPPIHLDQRGFVNSEPYTHTTNGEAVYLGAIETQGKYYAKLVTLKAFRQLQCKTALLQNRAIASAA